jgi:hypothetical protein
MRGKVPTPRGPVEVAWRADEGRLDLRVPPGAVARVVLPGKASAAGVVSVNGKFVRVALEQGNLVIEGLPPGRYEIVR